MDGRTAARNMISGNTLIIDYQTVPSVVFTSPLLASVGHGEDEAEKCGIKAVGYRRETSDWYSSRRVGIVYSGYKILIEEQSGRISRSSPAPTRLLTPSSKLEILLGLLGLNI